MEEKFRLGSVDIYVNENHRFRDGVRPMHRLRDYSFVFLQKQAA